MAPTAWLDPSARRLLRAGRPQADTRANTMAPYLGEGLGGLSTEHALTLSVRDSAALLDATAGLGAGDPYTVPPPARPFLQECGAHPGRLRIAFTTVPPNGVPVAAEYLKPCKTRSNSAPRSATMSRRPTRPIDRAAVIPTFLTLMAANTLVNLSSHPTAGRPARQDEVEKVTWASAHVMGAKLSAADYVRARNGA